MIDVKEDIPVRYFDSHMHRRGVRRMTVSNLIMNMTLLGYNDTIVYHTMLDYLGLPCNSKKSYFNRKRGLILTVNYSRKWRSYTDVHDYMFAALAYLKIRAEPVKLDISKKHVKLGKGLRIWTEFTLDFDKDKVFRTRASFKYFREKLVREWKKSEEDKKTEKFMREIEGEADDALEEAGRFQRGNSRVLPPFFS